MIKYNKDGRINFHETSKSTGLDHKTLRYRYNVKNLRGDELIKKPEPRRQRNKKTEIFSPKVLNLWPVPRATS